MHLKKILLSVLFAALLAGATSGAAKVAEQDIDITYRGISLYIDQEAVHLYDAAGTYIEPFIYADTTYLPLRAVAEALQMQVRWEQDTYSVYLSASTAAQPERPQTEAPQKNNGTTTITASYNNIAVYLNDVKLELKAADGTPVEPFIFNGTTYLPLRAIAEATNSGVRWDNQTSSIYIEAQESIIPAEPPYDVNANSDWTPEEAAAYGYTVDMVTYAEQGYAWLVTYNGNASNVLVPAKVGGKTAYLTLTTEDEQKYNTFSNNTTIKSVTFETGVQCGNAAYLFRSCENLSAVYNLPDSTNGINIFYKASNLQYVDKIPGSIKNMQGFYSNCPKITALDTIPAGVTNINNGFTNCAALAGDIYCRATEISKAERAFEGTVLPITLHVPYPSTSYTTFETSGLPANVTLVKTENQIAYLPKELYVSTFLTLNLYNEAISPDYADCTFTWDCAIGQPTSNGIALKGADDQLDTYPLTLTISKENKVLTTLTSTVRLVSPKNIKKRMALLTIGDTSTYNAAEWIRKINTYTDQISFVGTRARSHEGRINYTAEQYLQPFTYTGDKNGVDQTNPFYNPETEQFDWNYYKRYTGVSPSAVQLFFGKTGLSTANQTANVESMKKIVDAIRQAEPDIPIFIASAPYINNADKARMTATFNLMLEQERVFSGYENLYFVPIALTYDRSLNYNPKNKVDPNNAGYEQFGMCMFSALAASLQ